MGCLRQDITMMGTLYMQIEVTLCILEQSVYNERTYSVSPSKFLCQACNGSKCRKMEY